MAEPLLRVEDLRVEFPSEDGVVHAVDGITYEVHRGRTLGIVGESGSGKSVTCYSIMGLIPQPPGKIESGSAMFDGVDHGFHGSTRAGVDDAMVRRDMALRMAAWIDAQIAAR